MIQLSLLKLLADGAFHSGESLGKTLRISRTAVWKQLKQCEDLGIELYSVRGRGYRIPGGLDLLNEADIRAALNDDLLSSLGSINIDLVTDSTNQRALDLCQKGGAQGALFLAEQQTAGRGRRGRQWISPFSRSLYFSLVWSFSSGVAALEGLSLLVGLALLKALQRLGVSDLALKWPNDLLHGEKKLAGILLEMSGDLSGDCQVVIGVGVNVSIPAPLAEGIDQPWIDLETILGKSVERNLLMAEVLNQLVPMLISFSESGFKPWVAEWQSYHYYHNKRVKLSTGAHVVEGVCIGVAENGGIVLQNDSGTQVLQGGEISLRGLKGA